MSSHGLTRPDRAGLASRLVADGEDEIQVRRTRGCELIPWLATQTLGRNPVLSQQFECQWMNFPGGEAPCAVSGEMPASQLVQDALRHDAARGVSRAQKQDVELVEHVTQPVTVRSTAFLVHLLPPRPQTPCSRPWSGKSPTARLAGLPPSSSRSSRSSRLSCPRSILDAACARCARTLQPARRGPPPGCRGA